MWTISEKNFGKQCVSGGCAGDLVCDSSNLCACANEEKEYHAGNNLCENSEFNKLDIYLFKWNWGTVFRMVMK